MDERGIIHRYKATRWALIAGLIVMGIWFQYDLFINRVIRWDFLITLTAMMVAKLLARFYYSKKN